MSCCHAKTIDKVIAHQVYIINSGHHFLPIDRFFEIIIKSAGSKTDFMVYLPG